MLGMSLALGKIAAQDAWLIMADVSTQTSITRMQLEVCNRWKVCGGVSEGKSASD